MEAKPIEFDPYRKWLGIPARDLPPNHYRLLGIEVFESDSDAIEHAADQRMAHLRSLQTGKHGALSQRLLNEIAAAQVCLLNAKSKSAYDAHLRAKLAAQNPESLEPRQSVAAPLAASLIKLPFATSSFESFGASFPRPAAAKRNPSSVIVIVGAAATVVLLGIAAVLIFRPSSRADSQSTSPDPHYPIASNGPMPEMVPPPVTFPPPQQISGSLPPTPPLAFPPPRNSSYTNASSGGTVTGDLPIARPNDKPGVFAANSINLLKLINPARDSVSGRWIREGTAIVSPGGQPWARLQIPYKPPSAYELTAVVERVAGRDSFSVGLVVGNSQPTVVIDGWGNQMCGIGTIDRRWGDDNESTVHVRNVLQGGQHTILSRVHPDRIEILVDQKKLIDWRGDSKRLAIDPRNPMPNREQLYLVTFITSYRITELDLKPLADADK